MTTLESTRRKLVIVGDGAAGKTSLLNVFALGEFPKEYQPTVFENYVAELKLDGRQILLSLWDTAGQEEYERLRPLSYASAHVVLIAFSLDTPDSLENAQYKWAEEVRRLCGSKIPILLVGCKSDIREASKAEGKPYVTKEQGSEIALQMGARSYHECSALLSEGVDNVFEAATRASMLVRGGGATGATANGMSRYDSKRRKLKRNEEVESSGCCKCIIL